MRKQTKSPAKHSELTPVEPGKMLRSFKARPNDLCSCKSGLKVKKCNCDIKPKIITTKQIASPMPKQQYLYISTKYTHRKDLYFFFWRSEAKGYNFTREEAGIFDLAYSTTEHVFSVRAETVAPHFIQILYRTRKCHVLPNTPAVRKALGIKVSDLKSQVQYQF